MKCLNDSEELGREIKQRHFVGYQEFTEIKLTLEPDEEGFCYRCNSPLQPLTYLDPNFYYCPCWDCAPKKKSEREALTGGIIRNIKNFYSKLPGDRYYQLFLVDDIYFRTTFPHDYNVFKRVVNSLDPPGRNDIWFLDWVPGYPKIISMENLRGIKIVNLTSLYSGISLEKDKTIVGDYEIRYPETVSFDNKHHSRYSLLNPRGDRKSKRLKLGDQCIKLFNTEYDNVKSLFKLYKNGEEFPIRNLTYQDYVIIKLGIMRNKSFTKLIFDVVLEISKYIKTLRDTVFLKNTVLLDPDKGNTGLNLLWSPISEYRTDDFINVSII
jgi:hypothetical protein